MKKLNDDKKCEAIKITTSPITEDIFYVPNGKINANLFLFYIYFPDGSKPMRVNWIGENDFHGYENVYQPTLILEDPATPTYIAFSGYYGIGRVLEKSATFRNPDPNSSSPYYLCDSPSRYYYFSGLHPKYGDLNDGPDPRAAIKYNNKSIVVDNLVVCDLDFTQGQRINLIATYEGISEPTGNGGVTIRMLSQNLELGRG